MRLAAKLVLLYLVGLLLIVGLFSYLTIHQEKRIALAQHQRHASDLAAAIQSSLDSRMGENDENSLRRIITRSTREIRHVHIRWVDLHAGEDGDEKPSVPRELIVSRSEVTTIRTADASGRDVLYTYVPITGGDAATGDDGRLIEVSAPDVSPLEMFRNSVVSSLLALIGVAALSAVVILVGGVMMVGRPLEELIKKVQRVGRGDFGHPVQPRSHDELGRLAVALNDMCEQLASQNTDIGVSSVARFARAYADFANESPIVEKNRKGRVSPRPLRQLGVINCQTTTTP